ncbi:hypothetical protein BPUN_2300 [Candidatus Paraburkholderia kirkii]|nr:hypothetical protein BPUN_2300 [Candidatus Paraburkholderia kirkii]
MPADAMELHSSIRGAGRDLVLLHPVGLDHAAMDTLATLAARTHRVVSMDLRGHGASLNAPPGSSLEDWADDVHVTIRAVARVPPSCWACRWAAWSRRRWHGPESVSALVLCGCTGTFPAEVCDILRERGRAAERDGMSAVIEPTLDRWFTPDGRRGPFIGHVRERLLRDRVSNWSATWHAIALHDMLPKLGAVRVPTLVVAGECDAATPLAATRELAGAIPGARWVVLPGAPHMMQMESGAALNVALMDFLAGARAESAEASS